MIQKFQNNLNCIVRFLCILHRAFLKISLHIFHFLNYQGLKQSCALPLKINQGKTQLDLLCFILKGLCREHKFIAAINCLHWFFDHFKT